jgi:hypothetical protein
MMGASQSILELVAAAQTNAKAFEDRILDIRKNMDGQDGSAAQIEELRVATTSLELAAVDTLCVFEARMQHHFKRGPFSRKLKSLLLGAEENDLADRIHQYYLAINVLKHGKGASYRELLNAPSSFFVLRLTKDIICDDADTPTSLIDINVPGFFDGMTATILEAYHFLENR